MNYKVSHSTKLVECQIDLPSSKSISNRLLIIRAISSEKFRIFNLSESEDSICLNNALNSKEKVIDVGPAGTNFRFLTALFSTMLGKQFILTGSNRMKERPIKDLVDSLRILGAKIEYIEKENFPPLKITGQELEGRVIRIDGGVSSQFISSLLLIAPIIKNGLEIEIVGNIVSKPYLNMTLSLMKEFGILYTWIDNKIKLPPQNYIPKDYLVESDWSSSSFWFQIASLSQNCNITLNGLYEHSIQGDIKLLEYFENLGVNSTFINNTLRLTKNQKIDIPPIIDLLDNPDLFQPLRCTLFGLGKESNFKGLNTLQYKETNRIRSVENELLRLNSDKIIDTYHDHRMAMSFAPLCLKFGELQINNSDVVRKSYPNFWDDLQKGGFKISS